jgi:hypothetical protein
MIAGGINMVATSPERHEFLAKEVSTGMKLAIAPIDEPPSIAPMSIKRPRPYQQSPF